MDCPFPRARSSRRGGCRGAPPAPSCRRRSDLRRRCNGSPSDPDDNIQVQPSLMRTPLAIAAALLVSACAAKAPPAPPPPKSPEASLEEKASWILRLEDQRALRDPAPDPPPPPPPPQA